VAVTETDRDQGVESAAVGAEIVEGALFRVRPHQARRRGTEKEEERGGRMRQSVELEDRRLRRGS